MGLNFSLDQREMAHRAADYRLHRQRRLWDRFVKLAAAAGVEYFDPGNAQGRMLVIGRLAGDLPGWQVKNSLEAGDLAASKFWDADFEPDPNRSPTEHRPGTRKKLRVLALRIQAGVELFHPADGGPQPMIGEHR